MIQIEGLTKAYGPVTAVRDINMSVEKGEVVGFLGPNGAGKSTTMKIITCFMPPTSGSVRVNGYDATDNPMEVRKSIGYLPENVPLYHVMTVERFLYFAAQAKEMESKNRKREVDRVISECNLDKVKNRVIGHLSKGYRQRVGLAQALINNPPLLILDEPTIGLDPTQIVEIRSLIKGLGQERTVVLSSHILPEVSQICGRVIIINKGRVVATDTPQNLTNALHGSSRLRARILGKEEDVLGTILSVNGVINAKKAGYDGSFEIEAERENDHRAAISRAVINGGFDLLEFETVSLSLEDIFVQLVTQEEEQQ